MKNRKINFIKLGILLFGISLFLWNCEKEEFGTFNPETNENVKNLTFKEAIDFFNQNNNKTNLYSRESNPFTVTPDWETIAHQQLVYSDASLVKANTDINREGNYNSQLIFINISGQIKNVICTTYKDKTDVDGNMIDGRVYFNETNGTFLDAYKIEDKLFTKRLVLNQESNVQQAGFLLFLFQEPDQQDCWNTDNLPDNGVLDEVVITSYNHQMLTAGGYLGDIQNYDDYVNNATGMNTGSAHSSGLTNGQITDAAGAILSSPPIDQEQCPEGQKFDFDTCVDNCRQGKTYNETTKKCECTDSNKIEDWQGNCIENPCNKITNLFNSNANVRQELINLKGFTSATTERGRYKLTTASVIQSPPTGSDGYVDIPIPASGQYEFFAHTHNSPASATLSIPSFEDIEGMATLLKLGKIDASNFVFFLMTSDGTNYAITIDDPAQFLKVFATQYDDGFDFDLGVNRYNMRVDYYLGEDSDPPSDPLIKEDNLDKVVDEKLFLDFLEATQMGLSLFEVNDTFNDFTRVTHNKTTDNVDKDNCN